MTTYPTNSLRHVIEELHKANDKSADVKTQCLVATLLLKLELQYDEDHKRMTSSTERLQTQLTKEKKNNKVLRQLMAVVSTPKVKPENNALN